MNEVGFEYECVRVCKCFRAKSDFDQLMQVFETSNVANLRNVTIIFRTIDNEAIMNHVLVPNSAFD